MCRPSIPRQASFVVPTRSVGLVTRTFKRKDKWLEHVEDAQHQLDNFCPVQHCEKEARGDFRVSRTQRTLSSTCSASMEGLQFMSVTSVAPSVGAKLAILLS